MTEKRRIYMDYAATTPLSPAASSAMQPYFAEIYQNPSARYSVAHQVRQAVEEARGILADCIGAKPGEIFFTAGGTESDNWALKGTMFSLGIQKTVITDAIEHHAVLNSCAFLERMGYRVCRLMPDGRGMIHPRTLQDYISHQTGLVSIMTANNELGTIQPIQQLAAIAHEHGALFHTDAVQAMGHIPMDVHALGVDMLSGSAHKFGGPKGVGFLYVREGIMLEPLISGGGQEHGRRAGTENVAGIVGMVAALRERCHSLDTEMKSLQALRAAFLSALGQGSLDFQVNGGPNGLPGIISLSLRNMDGEKLLHRLDLLGIQVSTGAACDSQRTQISHVLEAIGLPLEYARGTIRISLGVMNTEQEVAAVAAAIERICRR